MNWLLKNPGKLSGQKGAAGRIRQCTSPVERETRDSTGARLSRARGPLFEEVGEVAMVALYGCRDATLAP